MAILNAIVNARGSSLLDILHSQTNEKDKYQSSMEVQVCALLDSNGSPAKVANVAAALVEEGYPANKLQVARWGDPIHSALILQEVRKKVGCHIDIRADANRRWTYKEAMEFSSFAKDCGLQYIEPVQDKDNILKFCKESGLAVALDETIDNIHENHLEQLAKFSHTRIAAVDNVLVFLHCFLGTGDDWIAIMNAMSGTARCISVDLPGHGKSIINTVKIPGQEPCLSLEIIAGLSHNLIDHVNPAKVTLVGYSMGARIALYMALKFGYKAKGAVLISGSPGLNDKLARKIRASKDDSRACSMVAHGLQLFLESCFQSHPHFNRIIASRLQQHDVQSLAKMLSGLSIGRQPSLREDLKNCRMPLLLMYGEKDTKFKKITEAMINTMCSGQEKCNNIHEVVEVPITGHAVHLENPLLIISALTHFMTRLSMLN